jgi:hypothetical protein
VVWACTFAENSPLSHQPHSALSDQTVDGGMDGGHRVAPTGPIHNHMPFHLGGPLRQECPIPEGPESSPAHPFSRLAAPAA